MGRFLLILAFLALTMGFGSMSAHAIPVSFELTYIPFFPNNVFVDATIFLNDADNTGGTVEVPLTSVDVVFRKGTDEISCCVKCTVR